MKLFQGLSISLHVQIQEHAPLSPQTLRVSLAVPASVSPNTLPYSYNLPSLSVISQKISLHSSQWKQTYARQ